jgi:hypothetical protein
MDKNKENQTPEESEYPESKWSKMEALEDQFLLIATKKYDERLRQNESITSRFERNKNVVLNLDNNFLTSVYRKYVLSAYLYNLSLIFLNYKILKGMKRFKKYTINTLLFVFGNCALAMYWMYNYPLIQFNSGHVKLQSNVVQTLDQVQSNVPNFNNKI